MDVGQLYDVYDLWYVPFWRTWWFTAGVVVACVVAVYFLYRWYKRITYMQPPVCKQLLAEILVLQKQYASRHVSADAVCVALISCIKTYLHHVQGVSLYEKTDTELAALVPTVLADQADWLVPVCALAAQVKFLAHVPSVDMSDAIARCIVLIKNHQCVA